RSGSSARVRALGRAVKFECGSMNNPPVPAIVRQVKLAESLGFDTAWITDSHLVCRELWVTLTACALGTSKIRLGPGVTVPHTRHFSVTASAIATLHDLAGDRLVLGIGTGGSSGESMGLSRQRAGRTATLEAMVHGIRSLVDKGPARFETGVEGRLAWLAEPRPVPIYVAGSGPKMLRAAGRLGDGVIMYAGTAPEILRARLGHVAEGARERGRQPARLDVVLWGPSAAIAWWRGITSAAAWPPRCATHCRSSSHPRTRSQCESSATRTIRINTRRPHRAIVSWCPTASWISSRSPGRPTRWWHR